MATKTRRPHTKSRNGCVQCKKRRIKCDEIRPTCVNCEKYGTTCEYPLVKKLPGVRSFSLSDQNNSISTPPSREGSIIHSSETPSSQHSTLNIPDLRLLHNYSTKTYLSLTLEPQAQEAWKSYVTNLAFSNPFLLHGILALSALHLSRLEPAWSAEYLLEAVNHHDAALQNFRSAVKEIEPSNFEAVVCFVFINFPYSYGFPIDDHSSPHQILDMEIQHLSLIRMVRPLISIHLDEVPDTGLVGLVPSDIRGIDWETTPRISKLNSLHQFSEDIRIMLPDDENEAYDEAIRLLEVLFSALPKGGVPASISLLKLWPHLISSRYLELLSEARPGALIIFSHYAVALRRSEKYWFLEGSAVRILKMTEALLDERWKVYLEWPKEQIRLPLQEG